MNDTPDINKEAFLTARACLIHGWHALRGRNASPSVGDRLRMEEGKEVHARARSLHPDGVFAGSDEQTNTLLGDGGVEVLFEAGFRADGYAARADWIRAVDGGFIVGEIKSKLHREPLPDDVIDDMAYTVMVLRRAGLAVAGVEAALLNRDWRLGMSDEDLFIVSDHTEAVNGRVSEFDEEWNRIREPLIQPCPPEPGIRWECKGCEFFDGTCDGVEDPVFLLPRLRANRFAEMKGDGILSIHDLPDDYKLTQAQRAVADAIQTGAPVIDRGLIETELRSLQWPVAYLDFETVKTAIPLWPDTAPHEQVVTQYSLHISNGLQDTPEHRDYLADPSHDCRRELAERLLEDLKQVSSILVYSSFESRVIGELTDRFPDLAGALTEVRQRLFDLEPVLRKGIVHPEFRGRTSLKVVLPVVAPEVRYDDLAIGDGDSAIAMFAAMAKGAVLPSEMAQIRRDLLAYCKLDTLALVRLHGWLSAIGGSDRDISH